MSIPERKQTSPSNGRKRQTRIILALAMQWCNARDRLRLRSLSDMFPGTKIITVSECNYTYKDWPHLSTCFNEPRGQKTISIRIETELKLTPGAVITVILDYYWCHSGYYTKRYGLNWVKESAHRFLISGAYEVLLPYDKGESSVAAGRCDMDTMLQAPHREIVTSLCTFNDNPLWVASSHPAIAARLSDFDGGCNVYQSVRYLHPETPFVRVMLRR